MNSEDVFVSLDIGTSSIKVVIGEMAGESLNVIGVGESVSYGIRKGSIVDIDETVRSIQNAVEQAERMVGLNIKSVIVGVSGNHIQLRHCHGIVAVSNENHEIGDVDIARVIDAAQVMSIPPEREIIDVVPEQFIVDGVDEIHDPRGMIGVRLEMEGTLITGSKTVLHNLLRCVEKAGLQISDVCLQTLALSSVALSKDEKNLGVALIDIGGGATSVAVFDQGSLLSTFELPIGGNHITKDISIIQRIPTDEAEQLKVKHGAAFVGIASEEDTFTASQIGSAKKQMLNQEELAEIIEARMAEIFDIVREELERIGIYDLPGGFVLTGGVTAMPGVLDLAVNKLASNVRIAAPDYIGVREPKYTACIGLIQFAYHNVKIQGKEVAAAVAPERYEAEPKQRKQKKKINLDRNEHEGVTAKVKNWFNLFFD
ncbi:MULTISPECIES: cell division protein FtsA [unclassified Sporolactobacillus]|uniref:cell division protein FtsA n=1 Tax=unclassified Sporolactobacillus TaxID=2628533 RepID=UPI002367435B|nr:cell division protein FtsA [Sporolactobacillus sp. CQH2019]MDD9147154.1 cell division protein FtsA [Sporolactobacillus sp. CQH2019]